MANTHSLDLESSSSQYAYITDANQTGLDITGDISFEAWIKLETRQTDNRILTKSSDSSGNWAYWFEVNGTQIRAIYSQDGSTTWNVISSSADTITDDDIGVWVHVACTIDVSAQKFRFYKDGSFVNESTGSGGATSIYNSNASFKIGNWNTDYFDGLIDEVRVWSDVRTDQEIADNYDEQLTGSESNLEGYWKLNNDYADETSNGNDLTAGNSPTFSTSVPFVGFVPTFPDNWTVLASLTVDNTKVSGSSNLTDFPTLVKDGNLTDEVYASIESDGKDIRFTTDEAGTTEVPFEIVSIDTSAKTCQIWVKLELDYNDDTVFYVWGNQSEALPYASDDTYGSENVWKSTYEGVYHMEDASGTLTDSTSNGRNGTFNGDLPDAKTGKLGDAQDFDGTGDTVTFTNNNIWDSDFTVQAIVKADTLDAGSNYIFRPGTRDIGFREINSTWKFNMWNGSTEYNVTTASATGSWKHLTVTRSTSTGLDLFENGSSQDTDAFTGNAVSDTATLTIGNRTTKTEYFDGLIDEFRYLSEELSPDWIATEYANQNAPSTFITGSAITPSTTSIKDLIGNGIIPFPR